MKTGAQYLESLNDGRATYFEGRRVTDVMKEPLLAPAAMRVANSYDRYYSAEPGAINPLMQPPKTIEELRRLTEERDRADLLTSLTFESLQTILTASNRMADISGVYRGRIDAFFDHALKEDLRIAECITDAKGDRSLPPSKQDDPDAYLHVVERQPSGVVIRGAKLHITGASLCHTLMVMPTKAMKPNEGDYAIACAVDVNSPGVRVINVTWAPRTADDRHFPISRQRHMPTCLVVFDNVFVPNERVFLNGETAYATVFAHSLGLWLRLGSTHDMAAEADTLVGFAQLIAEANGTANIPHIREKINEMIIDASLIRAGLEASIYHAEVLADGSVTPSELYTNVAKYHGATSFGLMIRHLQDIAGGSIITSPSLADLDNPETREDLQKYWKTGANVDGEYRLRLFHAIRDYTADTYGGWQMVTRLHGAGGLQAQQIVSRKHYDMDRARSLALQAAGMAD